MKLLEANLNENIEKDILFRCLISESKNSEMFEYVSFERGILKSILDICYFLKATG